MENIVQKNVKKLMSQKIESKEEHLILLKKASEYFKVNAENVWFDMGNKVYRPNLIWGLTELGHRGCYLDKKDDRCISKQDLTGFQGVYSDYKKTLPQAEKIYKELIGEPKSHREWAESFNIIGKINRIIRNE